MKDEYRRMAQARPEELRLDQLQSRVRELALEIDQFKRETANKMSDLKNQGNLRLFFNIAIDRLDEAVDHLEKTRKYL